MDFDNDDLNYNNIQFDIKNLQSSFSGMEDSYETLQVVLIATLCIMCVAMLFALCITIRELKKLETKVVHNNYLPFKDEKESKNNNNLI